MESFMKYRPNGQALRASQVDDLTSVSDSSNEGEASMRWVDVVSHC